MRHSRIIFGDNQFLGVNHADEAKALRAAETYTDTAEIIKVLGLAYEAGVREFMFTPHERFRKAFAEILKHNYFPELTYTPCIPYAHKFADAITERGYLATATSALVEAPKGPLLRLITLSPKKAFSALMEMLVGLEVLMCKGLRVRGIFLQNVVTDLLLGLGAYGLLEEYYRYVSLRLGASPGFITMNHPLAVRVLCEDIGLERPSLCANLNAVGFRMNPSQSQVEASFATKMTWNIAMSIFASGLLRGPDAIQYILERPGVDSVLFGSASAPHIAGNVRQLSGRTLT